MSSIFRLRGAKKTSAKKGLKIGVKKPFYKGALQHVRHTQDCLVTSQRMYQDIVEMAHEGITIADPEDNLKYINKQFAKSLGYRVDELLEKNLSALATKTTAAKMRKETEKRKKGLKSRYEVTLYHRDGSKKYFLLSTSPMFGPGREFLGSTGVYADLTEKKAMEIKLEKKVKQIDALYRVYEHARMVKSLPSVLNGIAQEVVQAFPQKKYVYSKLIFDDKLYCYPSELERYYHKVEVPLVIGGVHRGSLKVGYSRRIPGLDGPGVLKEEYRLTRNVAQILCKHMYARGILDRYREIIKRSFTSIVIVSGGKILYVNPRFYRMFKCQERHVIGQSIFKFLPEYNSRKVMGIKAREGKGRRLGGERFDLAMIAQRINYQGKSAVLIRVNDISALKKAQSKLSGFNRELKKQVKDKTFHLEEANKRLQSLNQLKDEFIAITSHELRSPLTSIRGYLSFLIEEESLSQLSDPYREYLIRAYSTTDGLNYLINNILDVSRLDMGRFELQQQETCIIKLMRNILDSLSFQMHEKRLRLEFENLTDKDTLVLFFDSIRMSQVLRNILDNSVKFTKRGKKIRVTIEREDSEVVITVADQGVGIPKAKLEQIFDKFMQVKTTQTKYKGGVGLGLFIAKRIVELHGGRILASKNSDGGTTISIYLPIKRKP